MNSALLKNVSLLLLTVGLITFLTGCNKTPSKEVASSAPVKHSPNEDIFEPNDGRFSMDDNNAIEDDTEIVEDDTTPTEDDITPSIEDNSDTTDNNNDNNNTPIPPSNPPSTPPATKYFSLTNDELAGLIMRDGINIRTGDDTFIYGKGVVIPNEVSTCYILNTSSGNNYRGTFEATVTAKVMVGKLQCQFDGTFKIDVKRHDTKKYAIESSVAMDEVKLYPLGEYITEDYIEYRMNLSDKESIKNLNVQPLDSNYQVLCTFVYVEQRDGYIREVNYNGNFSLNIGDFADPLDSVDFGYHHEGNTTIIPEQEFNLSNEEIMQDLVDKQRYCYDGYDKRTGLDSIDVYESFEVTPCIYWDHNPLEAQMDITIKYKPGRVFSGKKDLSETVLKDLITYDYENGEWVLE